jgi:hypothetical protein
METLYDLLGVRPDDDAEKLKSAFRKAAKASHPDLHAGDSDAAIRFRQIVAAYDILRHTEQRATYDRLLKFKREQLRSRSKTIISRVILNIVSDAIAVVGVTIVLAGGYTLFAYLSKAPVESVKIVKDSALRSAKVAAVQPAAPADISDRDESRGSSDNLEFADMPLVTGALSGEVRLSLREKDDGVPKSSLPDFGMSDDKHDMKVLDTPDINTRDMKLPQIKPGKQRVVAKPNVANPIPIKRASIDNKETPACSDSQSCSGSVPPLFGVGF